MNEPDQITDDKQSRRPRRRLGLATVLVGGVTLLMLLAVGSVLTLTLTGATQNTFSLLGARATITLDLVESRIASQFDPVVSAAEDLSAQFADGRLNLDTKREQAARTFTGVLSALPQATAVIYAPLAGPALRVTLAEGIAIEVPDAPVLLKRQGEALEFASNIRERSGWLRPVLGFDRRTAGHHGNRTRAAWR